MNLRKILLTLLSVTSLNFSPAQAKLIRTENQYSSQEEFQTTTTFWDPTPKLQLKYRNLEDRLSMAAVIDIFSYLHIKVASTNQEELGFYPEFVFTDFSFNLGLEEILGETSLEGHLIYFTEPNDLFIGYKRTKDKNHFILGDSYQFNNILVLNVNLHDQGYSFMFIDRRFDYLVLETNRKFNQLQYNLVLTFNTRAPTDKILPTGRRYARQILQERALRSLSNETFDFPLKRTVDEYGTFVVNLKGSHQEENNSQTLFFYFTLPFAEEFSLLIAPNFQRIQTKEVSLDYGLIFGAQLGPFKLTASYDTQNNYIFWTRLDLDL